MSKAKRGSDATMVKRVREEAKGNALTMEALDARIVMAIAHEDLATLRAMRTQIDVALDSLTDAYQRRKPVMDEFDYNNRKAVMA